MQIDCDGFEVETLISLRIHKANLKIIEVPSFEHLRIHGQSNLRTFRDGWRVLKTIIRERRITSPKAQLYKPVPTSPIEQQFSQPRR